MGKVEKLRGFACDLMTIASLLKDYLYLEYGTVQYSIEEKYNVDGNSLVIGVIRVKIKTDGYLDERFECDEKEAIRKLVEAFGHKLTHVVLKIEDKDIELVIEIEPRERITLGEIIDNNSK